ncbi:OmpA family protein [Pedobacter sp. JCM 36344]|uniref:OmpA family protein n=1 Tax=Pedobacter sp. JCM 36344 TaxID=3374280 RepID=UPI00397A151B
MNYFKKKNLTMNNIIKTLISFGLMMLLIQVNTKAQTVQPKWWFGVSGAANANFYDGTTQRLNDNLIVPTAFHKGKGIRPFGSVLMEYRPNQTWGGALNIGYDGRGGKFDDKVAPCNCPTTLNTNLSYLTVEPTLRLNPWQSGFYIFAGPRFGVNLKKNFSHTQLKQPNTDAEFSEVRKYLFSGQVGVGYDIPMSSESSTTKFVISPFVSFHPYFGQDVRNIESWSNTTIRAGIALKFGSGKKVVEVVAPPVVPVDVSFSVQAPGPLLSKRVVSETLPLLNYVFFDQGSSQIPNRYTSLSTSQADGFKEVQLQEEETSNSNGRSARQLNVYYNVLNILGDRMRADQSIQITLSGASLAGPNEGKAFATSIKDYLVNIFGISENRIATNGRTKPIHPSEQPGGKKELNLLRQGDRRVDIQSSSNTLMMEVGGGMMMPVKINATQSDSMADQVVFKVDKASEILTSYTIDLTDQSGMTKQYGPFTRGQERISGKTILGSDKVGDYKVVMVGTAKDGSTIRKESTLHLAIQDEKVENGLRYSVLFNFNESNSIAAYDQFLRNIVSPLIMDGSTVIIHGHTDIIGSEAYNFKLSQNRAEHAKQIIADALASSGKGNVKFEAYGFGEALDKAPFDNNRPEERFYNRTVIIDINPGK